MSVPRVVEGLREFEGAHLGADRGLKALDLQLAQHGQAKELYRERLDHGSLDGPDGVDPLGELVQYLKVAQPRGLCGHVAAVLDGVERAAGPAL